MDRIDHRNGIWWYEAPLPPIRHTCSTWTLATTSLETSTSQLPGGIRTVRRCACGAISVESPHLPTKIVWLEVNSRRREGFIRESPARYGRRRPPSRWRRRWFRFR